MRRLEITQTENSQGKSPACGNFVYNFQIRTEVRSKYDLEESLFQLNGNVIFADFESVKNFAYKLNQKRSPAQQVRSGQVNALGLIDEIYHFILRTYEENFNPNVFQKALTFLEEKVGKEKLHNTLLAFINEFQPLDVFKGKITPDEYLNGTTGTRTNLEIVLEELMLLYFSNSNPANAELKELFDNEALIDNTSFNQVLHELETYFQTQPVFGEEKQFIFDYLRAPILEHPASLEEQLKFIKTRWKIILTPDFLKRILSSEDLIKEEAKLFQAGFGAAETKVPTFDEKYLAGFGDKNLGDGIDYKIHLEQEKFTQDTDWMPHVVLLAKNTYVWLDQLSKKYGWYINRLDQIPDEELDQISQWGFTGFWLIGVWERSSASRKIKQISGNPEAMSSAYSIYDYQIANDLGGEDAFQNLNYRCQIRGIRLASDMVPNHMAIFSRWILEHQDYFIQTPVSPFPNYSYTGIDLSDDPAVQIRIEDGYWSRKDAAVVFQLIDNRSGEVKYIYHGNDGTNMPWNDTAQLNLLKSEVRESLIQMILHVARKFSIIRFDAAMTLTQKHYQRLWFPPPGSGGDIPSRAGNSLSSEDFFKLYPKEFWREVVDRINSEMPNTLLLAEAFWLLEGYFVRTLGMHRVYNSAFMNMLKKEENAKYRDLITNTLEFNPEILKRYVNFMSNPDEETAVKQFGDGDKYFGVAIMMITLPGLPMFGHGQIEGYHEKYGMEYSRAYYNELPNQYLLQRHQDEIFPLTRKRHLFSQVENFEFYDFRESNGNIIEDVFAYTNLSGNDRALIIYNNSYSTHSGSVNHSTGKNYGQSEGVKELRSKNLGEALLLKNSDRHFYIFRDLISKQEYIRSGKDFYDYGLTSTLRGYQYFVFLDFIELFDFNGELLSLANELNGRGVDSIQDEVLKKRLLPIQDELIKILETYFSIFTNSVHSNKDFEIHPGSIIELKESFQKVGDIINQNLGLTLNGEKIAKSVFHEIRLYLDLLQTFNKLKQSKKTVKWFKNAQKEMLKIDSMWLAIFLYIRSLYKVQTSDFIDTGKNLQNLSFSLTAFEAWLFNSKLAEKSKKEALEYYSLLSVVNSHFDLESGSIQNGFDETELKTLLIELLENEKIQSNISVHEYQNEKYFNKERFDEFLQLVFNRCIIDSYLTQLSNAKLKKENKEQLIYKYIKSIFEFYKHVRKLAQDSDYKFEELKNLLNI